MKPVQTFAQKAQTAAKIVKEQTTETVKLAERQTGLAGAEVPAEVPQVIQTIREVGPSNIDRQQIENTERKMLADLEAQLNRIRAESKQKLESYNQSQQTMLDAHKSPPQAETIEPPKGKVRKMLGQTKKTISSIISGRKQAESKMGTGKG